METQRVTPPDNTPPAQFTQDAPKGIVKYTNRVQGLAYGGAAMLVIIIGLRALYGRQVPEQVVLSALGLEAVLLLMIAFVYYMTPEDKGGVAPSTDSQILSGEKEIVHLIKKEIITGVNEMIKVLKNDVVGGQREMTGVLRNELVTSLRETNHALRNELVVSGTQTVQTLQRTETHIATMNDLLSNQNQQYSALRSELLSGEAEALRVLQRIESHIGKVVENEIERVVQSKVQEVFTAMVRQEVHNTLQTNRTENS
jgi:hypothetical protein